MSKPNGFATLSPERRAEISRLGGKAAQATGRGHRFTAEEARAAGSKGGLAMRAKRKAAAESELVQEETLPQGPDV
jgi:uncharacterized protein